MADNLTQARRETTAARIAERRGDYNTAARHYANSGELLSDDLRAWAYHEAAVAYRKCGELGLALAVLHSAADAIQSKNVPYLEAQIHLTLSNVLADYARWDEAATQSRIAQQAFRSTGSLIEAQYGAISEARCMAATGQQHQAIEIYRNLVSKGNPHEVRSQAMHNLALLYAERGEEDQAIELLMKDLRYCEQAGDLLGQFLAEVTLAQVLTDLGRTSEAVSHATLALSLGEAYKQTPTYRTAEQLAKQV